jgi:hypothetical protein
VENGLRQILKENIEKHRVASARAADAAETAAKAVEFVKATETAIGAFHGIDEKVAGERALAIRVAISEGKQPRFELSESLAGAVSAKLQAENHLTAARKAAADLASESVDAQAEERRELAAVQEIANLIVSDDIHEIALAVQSAEATATGLRIKLKAAEQIAKWLPGGGAKLSRLTLDQMNAPSPKEIVGMNRTPAHNSIGVMADSFRQYHTALCSNAEEVFEPSIA